MLLHEESSTRLGIVAKAVVVVTVVRLSLLSPVAAGVSRRPSNRVLDKRRLAGTKNKKEGIGDDA